MPHAILPKNTDNSVARIIDKGIQRIGKPIDAIEKSMENVGKLEMYKMERNLNILSLIAGIAPMFGFLRNHYRYGAVVL